MELTDEQVLALAPDSAAASAGKKLAVPRSWQRLGSSDVALWGECQGSALYQVGVDLSSLTVRCSCPSRKIPCKHSLGLMLLAAQSPAALPAGPPPDWVQEWLAKRAAASAKREAKTAEAADGAAADPAQGPATFRKRAKVSDEAARSKRADRRLDLVTKGLDALDLWLEDLVRNGLAAAQTQPFAFWERQAARMVDAQAPGVAARIRSLGGLPSSAPDWPERLLARLGKLALLSEAFRRLDQLDPELREDVRTGIGWNVGQEEVLERGERVTDDWLVVGQRVTADARLRTQSNWLLGARTGRHALVLQFAVPGASFGELLVPGSRQPAELVFWPSAYPVRALVNTRCGAPAPIVGPLPGEPSVVMFLGRVAAATARQPWLDRFPVVLSGVVPVLDARGWWARDRDGAALPLGRADHWLLLALTGGRPLDLAAEWDGYRLLPLGAVADGRYHQLGGATE